jgi:hypothetical protein
MPSQRHNSSYYTCLLNIEPGAVPSWIMAGTGTIDLLLSEIYLRYECSQSYADKQSTNLIWVADSYFLFDPCSSPISMEELQSGQSRREPVYLAFSLGALGDCVANHSGFDDLNTWYQEESKQPTMRFRPCAWQARCTISRLQARWALLYTMPVFSYR